MAIVSYFNRITQTSGGERRTIQSLIEEIQSNSHYTIVEAVRKCEDKKIKQTIKRELPYFITAGIFIERKKSGLQELSGLGAIDIDGIDMDIIAQKIPEFKTDPYIHAGFVSPSGKGYKLIVGIHPDETRFSAFLKGFYNYIIEKYNIPQQTIDTATCDISRACYLSHDPKAWIKESYEFWDLEGETITDDKDTSRSAKEMREVVKLLYAGKTKEYIYEQMSQFEKWNNAPEQYRDYTYKKAKDFVNEHAPTPKERIQLVHILTNEIMVDFNIYTMREEHFPEMYIYQDGVYVPNGRAHIKEFIKTKMGKNYSTFISQKVIDNIEPATYIEAKEFFKEEEPEFICVQNGILNIKTKELLEFSPHFKFFQKLPVTFNPQQTCVNTLQHFQTILYPDDIPFMQEIYGYLLFRDYRFEKAFLFSGDGGNGKGKTLEQMKSLIGVDNCTAIDLKTLEEGANGFMLSFLHKKLANLGADIGKTKISETRNFKQLTGHDNITANRKHQQPIQFVNYAKMIFNANEIPPIDDKTDAFWRRWCIIRFDVAFKDKPEYDTLKMEGKLKSNHRVADTEIIKKLTEPEELSGVLNWALEGLSRLFYNNGFSYTKSEQKTKQMMQKYSNTVNRFASDMLEQISDKHQFEEHDDLYMNYLKYCHHFKRNFVPESESMFKRLLQELHSLRRVRIDGGYENRWLFVRYASELEVLDD